MKYKLLAADVDGTLLNSKKKITPKTLRSIQLAIDSGLKFVIASGRPILGLMDFVQQIDRTVPLIGYNGALVTNGLDEHSLYKQPLEKADADSFIRLGLESGTNVIVWGWDSYYVNVRSEYTDYYASNYHIQPELFSRAEDLADKSIVKVLWYDDLNVIEKLQKNVQSSLTDGVNCHTSQKNLLEFVHQKATKAIAMEKMGEYFGIRKEEMAAIGDGLNDMSMIKYAGLGVAMANGDEELKNSADHITLSNDEDGLAVFIESIL